jgi:hypothetical protein
MNALKFGMASALALATACPALAQQSGPYQPTPEYQQQLQQYQQQQQDYQDKQQDYQQRRDAYDQKRSDYEARRGDYARAHAAYEARLADYNLRRDAYDRDHGYGAYARYYGPAPAWDETHWTYYLAPAPAYGVAVAPAAPVYVAPAAPYYGANTAYAAPIRCDNRSTVTAGALGALAGAVLGSNIAAPGRHTEGAVLGGVVGAGIGAAVGHAHDQYKCDQRGPYFAYSETIPYREEARSARYDYYVRTGCRLAPAPINSYGSDYRYVRVCPDPDGRYRIVG